ncbi:MAG: 2-C-methyl-D-erythritol 4-phosphate cytidylyltransferase [candidate division WOR-3 bacterium]|nr:2-C-methyl-D-erythritol 4-phosphate cytidylyltransferase [candidate division WOR-3 bacterium]
MAVFAIIAGAGKGRRFGGFKQFFEVAGKPIIIHTAEIFENNELIDKIILAVPKRMMEKTKNLVRKFRLRKVFKIISGGKRRQDTVLNCIKAISAKQGIVVIHDAVRPFISQSMVNRGVQLCQRYKAVIFGTPIYDTIKLVKGRKVLTTVPRLSPHAIQTPQFFDLDYLKKAYAKVDFKNEFTDEASILESAGMEVYVFRGDQSNIKITTKKDLSTFCKRL